MYIKSNWNIVRERAISFLSFFRLNWCVHLLPFVAGLRHIFNYFYSLDIYVIIYQLSLYTKTKMQNTIAVSFDVLNKDIMNSRGWPTFLECVSMGVVWNFWILWHWKLCLSYTRIHNYRFSITNYFICKMYISYYLMNETILCVHDSFEYIQKAIWFFTCWQKHYLWVLTD